MCAVEKNGSTLLENDNMCYVNFRIREQECVPWCGEIQNQRSEVLGKTFNLHSNSTLYPRSVVSQSVSNERIREWLILAYTQFLIFCFLKTTHTISFLMKNSYITLYVSLFIFN